MKKLIPMIAVAASMASAFADVGPKDTFTGMSGTFGNSDYWCAEGVEANVVASGIEARGNVLEIVDAPSTTPLKRWYNANTVHNDEGATAQPIPTTGLYFDSMVKFTISEEIDQEIDPLAKIAVFACCNNGEGETNLVARAAYFGETTVATNYILKTGVDINWADWHRLTIKAIPYAEGKYGFVVYLDGTLCSYDGDAGNIGPVTGVAAKYYGTTKSLLPSLITGGSTLGKLTQVGFVGTGSLDDVDFTDVAPSFAQDALTITITKTEGVEKVIVNNTEVQFVNNSYSLELPPGTETIAISAVAAEGYALSWTGSDTFDVEGITQIDVTAFAVAFTVDGVPYAADKVQDAVSAAILAGKPLVLAVPYSGDPIQVNGDLTLDLAGKTITTAGDYAIIVLDGQLTIEDSSEDGTGRIDNGTGSAILALGTVVVRGGVIAGEIEETATFFGGSVIKGEESAFPYTLGDPEALEAKEVEGYWVIGPKEAEKTPLQIFLEAIAAIDGEGTVTLTGDIELEETLVIPAGKDITIDLKGFTIENTVAGYTIDNAGKLTIVDSAEGTKGTITHVTTDTSSTIRNLGTLEISDITVGGNYIGIKNDEGAGCNGGKGYGELTLNGVTFNGDDQAVQNWGHATITGGTFGGAVFTWADRNNKGNVAGQTTINGGTFNGTVAAVQTYNGAWPESKATVTINAGTFEAKAYGTYTTAYVGDEPQRGVIAVPTTSTAKFKVDETGLATIDDGYEFVKGDDDYYMISKKAAEEPTIPEEEGKIEKDQEGNYVVTPAQGTNTVDITNLPTNAKVIVPGSIDKINGLTEGATVIVKNGGYDITAACTITDGVITLNSEAIVEVDTEKIPVKPTIAEEVVVGGETVAPFNGTDTIAVKAIPGLKYTLVAGDEPGAVATPASEPVTATGTGVKLENTKFTAKGAKAFFKVQVSK